MKTIDRRHAVPFALVTSMFLLWGLANNMTDTLLAAFKRIMSMSDTQTSLIQFAFYGSYFCFALPAALFIRRRSFKSGIILGLLLYAAGDERAGRGIERDLAGDEHEAVGLNGLRIGTDGAGRRSGGNDSFHRKSLLNEIR